MPRYSFVLPVHNEQETLAELYRRLAATAEGILCLTAMETAVAAAEALDPEVARHLADVRSLDEWVPAARLVTTPA